MCDRVVYVYVKVSPNFVDLTARQFGRLGVVKYLGAIKKKSKWLCVCSCGTETAVPYQNLVNGHTQSCGCLHAEVIKNPRTHGLRRTREYDAWSRMIQRCHNKKHVAWPDYGGRGISVCEEWRGNFVAFYKHIGPKPTPQHSLDRINNDGNYEPGNVRWSTIDVQNKNRRKPTGASKRNRVEGLQ